MRLHRDDTLDPEVERELQAIDAALAGEPVAPELAELEALVRVACDDRPRPADAFAERLDERARVGFAAEPCRRRPFVALRARLQRRMLLPALGGAATLLVAVVVVTSLVGGKAGESETNTSAPAPAPASGTARGESPSVSAGGSPASAPNQAPRKVQRQASLTLEAAPDHVDDISQQVIRVTDGVDGVVANSSISSGEGDGASFELRIPSDRLQTALAQLSKLGHVRSRQESSQDVTDSFNSAKGQLDEALAERSSLLKQLAAAGAPNQAESIRARLRINAQRIGQARSGVADLRRRTGFATAQVTVDARKDDGAGGWTPDDALGDAGRVLEVSLGVLVVALAVALPVGLVFALVTVAARAARRRRREQALASG